MTKFNPQQKSGPKSHNSYFFLIHLSLLFILFDCAFAQSSNADELTKIANERANRALETSEKAFEKALDAEKVAQEALSNSQIATVLSNERFTTIRDLLYILSIVMGIC